MWFVGCECFPCRNGTPSIDSVYISQSHTGNDKAEDREWFTYEKTTVLPPRTGSVPPAKQQKTRPVLSSSLCNKDLTTDRTLLI